MSSKEFICLFLLTFITFDQANSFGSVLFMSNPLSTQPARSAEANNKWEQAPVVNESPKKEALSGRFKAILDFAKVMNFWREQSATEGPVFTDLSHDFESEPQTFGRPPPNVPSLPQLASRQYFPTEVRERQLGGGKPVSPFAITMDLSALKTKVRLSKLQSALRNAVLTESRRAMSPRVGK